MRVFGDEYKYCALLEFEKTVINPALQVSIRSLYLRRGSFLGPFGFWQARPYYFSLERIETEQGARFRAGPDITEYMLLLDRVEVCSDDGRLCEEGVWGELDDPVAACTREFMRTSFAGETETPDSFPGSRGEDVNRPLEGSPGGQFAFLHGGEHTVARSDITYGMRGCSGESQDAATNPVTRRGSAPGTGARWVALGVAVAAMVAIGFKLAPDIRCALPGFCAPSTSRDGNRREERAGAAVAERCAVNKSQVGDFCSVEACVAPYRAQFPGREAMERLSSILLTASADCESARQVRRRAEGQGPQAALVMTAQMQPAPRASSPSVAESPEEENVAQLFSAARQCASANPCVASACFAELSKRYGVGAHADEVTAELESASKLCNATPDGALPDGIYSGRATAACGAPQQFGIPVKVQGGGITWQHDVPLSQGDTAVAVQWNGTIDHQGNIRAAVRNQAGFQALGHYRSGEREIAMHYPGCVAVLSILGRVR